MYDQDLEAALSDVFDQQLKDGIKQVFNDWPSYKETMRPKNEEEEEITDFLGLYDERY